MRRSISLGPLLGEVQEALAARLLGPARGALVDVGTQLDDWLDVAGLASAAQRLDIYAAGYPARILDALADTYPAVARVVGAAAFGQFARRFAADVPLASYNLNDAGESVPAYLRSDSLTQGAAFVPDLAELEWRVAQAFHAKDCDGLDPRRLDWRMDDWARAVLRFQPSVAVLSSEWPLLAIWAAREMDATPSQIARLNEPEHLVVRRDGDVVRCESVTGAEARGLALLLADGHLFRAAERLETEGIEADAVLSWFSRWMSAGMIAGAVTSA